VRMAALPAAALEHAAHSLGMAYVGVGDHQAHASEAAQLEAAEELSPEGLALAVTDLQAQVLTAAVSFLGLPRFGGQVSGLHAVKSTGVDELLLVVDRAEVADR